MFTICKLLLSVSSPGKFYRTNYKFAGILLLKINLCSRRVVIATTIEKKEESWTPTLEFINSNDVFFQGCCFYFLKFVFFFFVCIFCLFKKFRVLTELTTFIYLGEYSKNVLWFRKEGQFFKESTFENSSNKESQTKVCIIPLAEVQN